MVDIEDVEVSDSISESLKVESRKSHKDSTTENSDSKTDHEKSSGEKKAAGRGNMNSSLPYYLKSLMSKSFIVFCLLMVFQTGFRVIQRKFKLLSNFKGLD